MAGIRDTIDVVLPAHNEGASIGETLREFYEVVSIEGGIPAALDAALCSIRHFVVARYGTLLSWANLLHRAEPARLLHATLEEERKTPLPPGAENRPNVSMEERLTAILDPKTPDHKT